MFASGQSPADTSKLQHTTTALFALLTVCAKETDTTALFFWPDGGTH